MQQKTKYTRTGKVASSRRRNRGNQYGVLLPYQERLHVHPDGTRRRSDAMFFAVNRQFSAADWMVIEIQKYILG